MSLMIISDLHIWGPEDPIYSSLLSLLRDRARAGDTLVFAGDIFDLFVGRKAIFMSRYSEFFRELKGACERGVRVHYIEGNHDFLIESAFRGIPGLTVYPTAAGFETSGKRFYFAHGDTVDRWDLRYRFLRVLFRSPVMKVLVRLVPGAWLDRIGKLSSRSSRKSKPVLPADLAAGGMEDLRKKYRNYAAERLAEGYDFVVMGHCHDLDEMSFNIGGRPGQYVNVGYPRVHGSFLSWTEGDPKIQRERLPRS